MSHPVQSESSTNTRTWIVSLMVVCLIGIPLLTLPFLFKIDSLSAMVLDQVEQRIGHTIEVGSMRVTVLPRIGVELTNVRMLDSSTTARIFSARRMELVLQALPLLRGQIVGKRLIIEQPHLEFHRDEAGQWSLAPAARRPPPTQAQTENPLALFAVVRNVLLTDGRITLTDHSTPSLRNVQLVTALQAIVSEGLPGRTATVQMQGEISGEPKTAVFSMEGTLLQTRSAAPDEKTAASPYPLQFDGTVRVDRLDVRQVADWLGRGSALDGAHGSARFSGRVRLVPRSNGYDLIVPEWTADVRDVSLRGEARVAGLHTATTGFSATLSSSSLGLQRWLDHIPERWMPTQIQTVLAEREIDGSLAIRTATVSGTLNSESPLDVAAEIEISDGRLRPVPHHPPIQRVSATVVYARQGIHVIDLQGDYGPIHLSRGEALITNLETDPMADARISATVQADGMISLAKALNAPYIESFLTGFEQAQGQIVVAAHLAGRPLTGERLNLLEADVTIHDVGFRKPTLPVPIDMMNGRVSFSPGVVRIDTLTGRVGPAQVEAQGSMTIAGGTAYQDLHIEISADGEELTSLLRIGESVRRSPEFAGPIRLAAKVTGPTHAPRIKAMMDMRETALGLPDVLTKPMGAPASIEFDGAVSADQVLLVRRLDLIVPPIRLTGEGHIGLSDEWDFEARVVVKPVSLSKLPKGISVGAMKAGTLEAALTMGGQGTDRTSWQASGRVRLKDGLIAFEGLKEPIRHVTLNVQLQGQDIDIQRLALTTGGSDFRARGSISNWTGAPEGTFVIESSQFDLRLLQPAGLADQRARGSGFPGPWLAEGRFAATVLAKAAYYDRFLFTNVSCRLSLDHGMLTIDQISGDTDEGHLAGRLVVQPPERRPGRVKGAFRIAGIPIERVLSLVGKQDVIKGWMSLNGKVEAELEKTGLLTASLASKRPIRLILEDGRIFNMPVISKLLAVMNVPAMLQGKVDLSKDGLPFDQVRGVFSVASGIVLVKELALAGPVLKISGSGRYDFVADQLDMVLATSPLGSYSDLLQRIPLFGRIFAGDREGFDTAVFEVKGPSDDPDITYLPAESLTRGVKGTAQFALDVLVNTLMLPKAIVDDFLGEDDDHD